MTVTIEETPLLELIPLNPLNPISVKNLKFDRLICLIISNIVAFWTEASKLTESEITTKMSIYRIISYL